MKQSELIGAFSHELRNPLTLINSSLQLLETECPSVLDCPLWPQLRRDMADVLGLLDDMSSLNKSGHVLLSDLSLSGFFSELRSSFDPSMEERGIRFTVSLKLSHSDARISADHLKLKEAVSNLLMNAMDAVSEQKGEKTVLLLAEQSGSDILIHVRDNGPGIPDEYMETLFDPFVTHKPHGTGLGLAIVKNIVGQHGGSVRVRSRAGLSDSYTDFYLRLPAAEA